MDANSKNKSFNIILIAYFVLLPFTFSRSILDPFLLARQLLTSVFLLLVLFFLYRNKSVKAFTFDPSSLLFAGFIAFCILSFSKSQILGLSHTALSKYLTFFLFFILVRHALLNGFIKIETLKSSVIAFGCLAISIALLAFIDKTIAGDNLFRRVNLMSGTFSNKNLLSSILFFCLPFYFVSLSISKKLKFISIAAIVLTVALLVVLRTRAVLIALAVFLFLILLYQIKNRFSKKIFYSLLAFLAITVSAFVGYLFSVKANFHSSSDIKIQYFFRLLASNTLYERLEFWNQAMYIIRDNFFGGVGVGNWIAAYPKYGLYHFSDPAISNGWMIVSNPHNDFLMVFSEIGIFGFLCYLGIFVSIFYQCYWLSKNDPETVNRRSAAYFLFFLIAYLIIAFFDFPLTRIEHQAVLLTVFAIVGARYLQINNQRGFSLSSKLIYLLSFVLLLYATTVLLFRMNSEKHLFKALEAEKIMDNSSATFEFNKAKNYFSSTDNYAIPLDWHLGRIEFNQGRFEESLNLFSNAYKVNPYSLVVNNDLGSSYIKNGNIAEGLKHYKEVLALSPTYEDARINLAATYFNNKQYGLAFETIDQCDVNTKNETYRMILTPIVEKKLNEILVKINNPKLNSYIQSKIKTEKDLQEFYFDYRKKILTFEDYIKSLIH